MDFVIQTDLSVDYRTRPGVLKNVAVKVKEGEILGLVGQSGSGKTTFVMALLGLLDPNEARAKGSVVVNVVLPEPLWPTRPRISPSFTLTATFFKTPGRVR